VKGIGKVFQVVNFTASPTAGAFITQVMDVPVKETMVVTDVVFCNNAAATASIRLQCSVVGQSPITIMAPMFLAPGQSFAHGFGQGIECGPGTKLVAVIEGGASAAGWQITVSGYLRKGG
jgi:hypothetical protein